MLYSQMVNHVATTYMPDEVVHIFVVYADERNQSTATFFATNVTWTDQGPNSGLRGDSPVTNRLSHSPYAI